MGVYESPGCNDTLKTPWLYRSSFLALVAPTLRLDERLRPSRRFGLNGLS
jgi:hypothetical protein